MVRLTVRPAQDIPSLAADEEGDVILKKLGVKDGKHATKIHLIAMDLILFGLPDPTRCV